MGKTAWPGKSKRNEPFWEIAEMFPYQGDWTEGEYLDLETNRLVEYDNGFLEVLPMPTTEHQGIVLFLAALLQAFVNTGKLGMVRFAPLRLKVSARKYREPDILFALTENLHVVGSKYWSGADLVMEIASDDAKSRQRDLVKKRRDYARCGIAEYWIIDPQNKLITVLELDGSRYIVAGEYKPRQTAESVLLDGFTVPVSEVLAAANV